MMSKTELIQTIADDVELTKKDVKAVLESLATHGYKEMKKTGEFMLPASPNSLSSRSRPPRSARASTPSPRSRPCSRRSPRARC